MAWGTPSRGLLGVLLSTGVLGLLVVSCGIFSNRCTDCPDAWAGTDSLRIRGIMEFRASDSLAGRNTGTPGLEAAASYLEENLRNFGIKPFFQTYRDTLTNTGDLAYNIVGVLPGRDPQLRSEYVVLGAHYDHVGTLAARSGDSIANGANDNASGTATVLELARFLASGKRTSRSVIVAFFSAEERGLLGSIHLANRLKQQGTSIYAVLNFEMTGVPMANKNYLTYLTGYDKSNLAEVSNRYAQGDTLVGFLPTAAEFNLFQRSDNYAFYEVFGIPAHTYSTFDFENYPYYHQVEDEAHRMDFGHMATLVNRFAPVVYGIANGPAGELKGE